jgi:S1-C subfamily serine protease
MTSLQSVSDNFAEIVEAASGHLVSVSARRRHPSTGIVWSEGVVVTASHAVHRDEGISVRLPSDSGDNVGEAALAGRDASTDVAVLRVETTAVSPPAWSELAGLRVGQIVAAVARPGGKARASLGMLAAVGGPWRSGDGGQIDAYVQPDLVMYPGFSGGALVAADGAFIGLNTSALLRGANTTIPKITLDRVVTALLAHGRMRRGYLGVSVQPVRLPAPLVAKLGQENGTLLVSVEEMGPAADAGLLLGDILVAIDGEPISQLDDLLAVLSDDRIGVKVPVQIVRGGDLRSVDVTVADRPAKDD